MASRQQPRFAVPLSGASGQLQLTPAGHARLHFPDCVISSGLAEGHYLAVELEKTAKGRSRLRRILSAYVRARHIHEVRYYTDVDRIRTLLQEEVAHLRASELVKIRDRSFRAPGGRAKCCRS
jgi:hypothetical protein